MCYIKLEIWQHEREMTIEIHKMSSHYQSFNYIRKAVRFVALQKVFVQILLKVIDVESTKMILYVS